MARADSNDSIPSTTCGAPTILIEFVVENRVKSFAANSDPARDGRRC